MSLKNCPCGCTLPDPIALVFEQNDRLREENDHYQMAINALLQRLDILQESLDYINRKALDRTGKT